MVLLFAQYFVQFYEGGNAPHRQDLPALVSRPPHIKRATRITVGSRMQCLPPMRTASGQLDL
jgi:hypothetical protein